MVEFAVLLVCSLFIGGGSTIVLVVVGYTHPKSGWQIASLEGTYSAAIQDARLCKEVSGDVARLSALSSLLVIFCAKANHGVVTFLTDGFKQKLEETILIFDPGYGTLIVGSPMGSRILPMKCLQLHVMPNCCSTFLFFCGLSGIYFSNLEDKVVIRGMECNGWSYRLSFIICSLTLLSFTITV